MRIFKKVSVAVGLAIVWVISAAIADIVINPPVSDVHINGHTWTNSMLQSNPAGWLGGVANDVGAVTALYPQGRFSPRVKLTASLAMYVDAAGGNDANNCLVGNPCRTIQHTFDVLRDGYDLSGNTVTVHLADGTYTPGLALFSKLIGQKDPYSLVLVGNEAFPANVVVSDNTIVSSNFDSGVGSPIFAGYGANLSVRGVTLVASFRAVWAHNAGTIHLRNVRFGTAGQCQVTVGQAAQIKFDGDYQIFGGASFGHYCAFNGGVIFGYDPANPSTQVHVLITNSPVYNTAFAYASATSQLFVNSFNTVYSGAVNAPRYYVDTNGIINTQGSGASYFPGSTPGVTLTGGVYN